MRSNVSHRKMCFVPGEWGAPPRAAVTSNGTTQNRKSNGNHIICDVGDPENKQRSTHSPSPLGEARGSWLCVHSLIMDFCMVIVPVNSY